MLGQEKTKDYKRKSNDADASNEQEIFERYSLKYGMDKKSVIEDQKQIDREWYIYKAIKEKGLENTNVERLIDLIVDDIHHQYEIKSDMENKIGFLFAFISVLLVLMFEQEILSDVLVIVRGCEYSLASKIGRIVCVGGLIISMIMTFAFMMLCLSEKISKPLYDDKDNYFKCAVDDKAMSCVYLLDVNTNVWINNEKANGRKATWFKASMISTACTVVFMLMISSVN